jgi:hypothetical protein
LQDMHGYYAWQSIVKRDYVNCSLLTVTG